MYQCRAVKRQGDDVAYNPESVKCIEIKDFLIIDVRQMDQAWADHFVAESMNNNLQVIVLIGGFPCKGLSSARGDERETLENQNSIYLFKPDSVLQVFRKLATVKITVSFIVKHVTQPFALGQFPDLRRARRKAHQRQKKECADQDDGWGVNPCCLGFMPTFQGCRSWDKIPRDHSR